MRYNITKFLILLMCLYLLVIFFSQHETSFSFSQNVEGSNLLYYTRISASTSALNCGSFFINSEMEQDVEIIGESIEISTNNLSEILSELNCRIVGKEYIENENLIIFYAYSNKIPKISHYRNSFVNLQIAIRDEKTIIGWPMILGSF